MEKQFDYYVKNGRSIIIGRTIHAPGKKLPGAFINENPKRIEKYLNDGVIEKKQNSSFDTNIPEENQTKKPIPVKKTSIEDLKKHNGEKKKELEKKGKYNAS